MIDLFQSINEKTATEKRDTMLHVGLPCKMRDDYQEAIKESGLKISGSSLFRSFVTSYLRVKGKTKDKPKAWEKKLIAHMEELAVADKKRELELSGRQSIRFDIGLLRELRAVADSTGTSCGVIIRELIHGWVLKPRRVRPFDKRGQGGACMCALYVGDWDMLWELCKIKRISRIKLLDGLVRDYIRDAEKHMADDWKYRTSDIDAVMARVYARSGKEMENGRVSEEQESQET